MSRLRATTQPAMTAAVSTTSMTAAPASLTESPAPAAASNGRLTASPISGMPPRRSPAALSPSLIDPPAASN